MDNGSFSGVDRGFSTFLPLPSYIFVKPMFAGFKVCKVIVCSLSF